MKGLFILSHTRRLSGLAFSGLVFHLPTHPASTTPLMKHVPIFHWWSFAPPPFVPTKLQGDSQEGGDGKWLNALRVKMKPVGFGATAGKVGDPIHTGCLCLLELTCRIPMKALHPSRPTPCKEKPQLHLGQAVWLHRPMSSSPSSSIMPLHLMKIPKLSPSVDKSCQRAIYVAYL